MTISTKYNIGDKVFRMDSNRVAELEVRKIVIIVESRGDGPPNIIRHYTLSDNGSAEESDIYPTRDELLKTL